MGSSNVGGGEVLRVVRLSDPYFTLQTPSAAGSLPPDAEIVNDGSIRHVPHGDACNRGPEEVVTGAGALGSVVHPDGTQYVPYPEHPTHAQRLKQDLANGRPAVKIIGGIVQGAPGAYLDCD